MKPNPALNAAFLFLGAVLANLIGATGASMLLIRPWVRMNRRRFSGYHTVFFIFLVSNIGGGLMPMGPPLFLGYLEGVPFWWVLAHCWRAWLLTIVAVLAIFYGVDRANYLRAGGVAQGREASAPLRRWKCGGLHHFGFLAVILAAVFLKHPPSCGKA